jgi:invasion protein IalB
MKLSRSKWLPGLASVLGLCAMPALAQPAAAPSTPPLAVTDTKPVGDWTVRCFSATSTSPCDMSWELSNENTHQRIVAVSLAYVPKNDSHMVEIAVPLDVSIPAGVMIKTDSYTSPRLAFHHCDQAGCYVMGTMPNDMVASLAKSGPNASVNIVGDDGKSFAVKFSLNGFAAAHDAMSALAKAKAKDTPADATAAADTSKKK